MDSELAEIAVAIVAANQPLKPNDLLKTMRKQHGASHREANTTFLMLLRDGRIRRTFTGKLVLPG
jgi:hypothetical protein